MRVYLFISGMGLGVEGFGVTVKMVGLLGLGLGGVKVQGLSILDAL